MRYNFKCESCSKIEEVAMPMSSANFEDRVCPYCKGNSKHYWLDGSGKAPGLMTSNMSNPTLDVVVGREAETRWSDIYRRQDLRDKVRVQSNQTGLSMVGRNEFAPITKEQKSLRTDLSSKITHVSYSESDSKLVKR